jgi:hypothetical protein
MKKRFTVAQIKDLLNQLNNEEISFSRFVEILNENNVKSDYEKKQAYLALFKSLERSSLTIDEMRQKINDLTIELYQKDLIDVIYKLEIIYKRLFITPLNFHTGLLFSGIYVPYDELINVFTIETEHKVFKWRNDKLITSLKIK